MRFSYQISCVSHINNVIKYILIRESFKDNFFAFILLRDTHNICFIYDICISE